MAALKLGIYLNSQHPEADDPSQRLQELVTQVQVAADGGFDSIWAGEHHLTPGFHFFPQLTLLAHLAAHSGDMALGTNLVLLPLHQPVDIAEQVALIDHACGGRFILTVGQGYRPEEFTAFGVPFDQRLARMLARDRFVIGDPDQVIAGLVAQHRQIGLTHLAMRIAWPGSNQEDTLGCLRLLGEAVVPQVRAELSR